MDTSQLTQIKKMYEIVKSSSNPRAMMESMAKSNPALKRVLDEISSSNATPQEVFYKVAANQGMSEKQIDEFVKSLQTMI